MKHIIASKALTSLLLLCALTANADIVWNAGVAQLYGITNPVVAAHGSYVGKVWCHPNDGACFIQVTMVSDKDGLLRTQRIRLPNSEPPTANVIVEWTQPLTAQGWHKVTFSGIVMPLQTVSEVFKLEANIYKP